MFALAVFLAFAAETLFYGKDNIAVIMTNQRIHLEITHIVERFSIMRNGFQKKLLLLDFQCLSSGSKIAETFTLANTLCVLYTSNIFILYI